MKLKIDGSLAKGTNFRIPLLGVSYLMLQISMAWSYKSSPGAPWWSLQSTRVLSVSFVAYKAKTPEVSLNGKEKGNPGATSSPGIFEKTLHLFIYFYFFIYLFLFIINCALNRDSLLRGSIRRRRWVLRFLAGASSSLATWITDQTYSHL